MTVSLLAEIRINRIRMEAKLGAEIKTIREMMDANQEKIETNQGETKAMLDACRDEAKAIPEKTKAGMDEMEAVADHQEVPKEELAV
jgi:hypothetical protein